MEELDRRNNKLLEDCFDMIMLELSVPILNFKEYESVLRVDFGHEKPIRFIHNANKHIVLPNFNRDGNRNLIISLKKPKWLESPPSICLHPMQVNDILLNLHRKLIY